MSLEPEGHAPATFSDLPHAEGVAWTKNMSQHSAPSFQTKLTYPGYEDAPVSYILCEEDKCVPPELQQSIIQMIEEESGRRVDVLRIRRVMRRLLQPNAVVEIVEKVAAS